MRSPLQSKVGIVLISVLVLQLVGLTAVSAAPGPWAPYPVAQQGMPGPQIHVVSAGETLFAIGRLYGVNPWAIARINRLPNPNIIFVGQVLLIGAPGPVPGPMPGPYPTGYGPIGYGPVGFGPGGYGQGGMMVHLVRYGETLFGIGRMYHVNPWVIARANGLFNPNFIFIGQVLCIPGPGPAVLM
jgi:LysM repeat protein